MGGDAAPPAGTGEEEGRATGTGFLDMLRRARSTIDTVCCFVLPSTSMTLISCVGEWKSLDTQSRREKSLASTQAARTILSMNIAGRHDTRSARLRSGPPDAVAEEEEGDGETERDGDDGLDGDEELKRSVLAVHAHEVPGVGIRFVSYN